MLEYIDWLVLILNLISFYLIGSKNRFGFVLGIVGCIIGIIAFSTMFFSAPLIIMYVSFGILNTRGYIKWK